jgi:hypothetical protein
MSMRLMLRLRLRRRRVPCVGMRLFVGLLAFEPRLCRVMLFLLTRWVLGEVVGSLRPEQGNRCQSRVLISLSKRDC